MGLLGYPPILFLDEPTSGLDASSCITLVALLKGLASSMGMNIVAVMHTPSTEAFKAFDHVLILAGHEGQIFEGTANECVEYFSKRLPYRRFISGLCKWLVALMDLGLVIAAAFMIGTLQEHERLCGVSVTSQFLSGVIFDLPWVAVSSAAFVLVYTALVVPRASLWSYYWVGLAVCWWSSGLAYLVSVLPLIPPQAENIVTVVLVLVLGAFVQGLSPSIRSARGTALKWILRLSYNRWAMEAIAVKWWDSNPHPSVNMGGALPVKLHWRFTKIIYGLSLV
ncbi:hypothetical protein GPECTOR_48g410 [Gonium pectorale]|uniref:ABC transporter family G domain-containing protein n=1 Tax=Gonium pectorale TaxID=33097 RepID=A0A150G833_GONPE|nr:hypothetical protein GPECTOR_48g410 [Gonium pectorale]|eukprot:KXZ45978.1 hypothetical protein GPECTOR_48g410 [Gonium pectorale]